VTRVDELKTILAEEPPPYEEAVLKAKQRTHRTIAVLESWLANIRNFVRGQGFRPASRMTRRTAFDFQFLATGIGSVPDLDVHAACLRILAKHAPTSLLASARAPQPHFENMVVQFTEGLPFIEVTGDRKALLRVPGHMEQELLAFYDRFLARGR